MLLSAAGTTYRPAVGSANYSLGIPAVITVRGQLHGRVERAKRWWTDSAFRGCSHGGRSGSCPRGRSNWQSVRPPLERRGAAFILAMPAFQAATAALIAVSFSIS